MAARAPRAERDRLFLASLTALGLAAGRAPSSPAQRDDSGQHTPSSPRVQRVASDAGQMLVQVEFADALRGFAVGGRPGSRTDALLKSISFPTQDAGYVVGSGGTILRTGDAGATWRAVQPPGASS